MSTQLELLDYRRRVHAHYAELRASRLLRPERCAAFRHARDELFTSHPQSALSPEQRARLAHLDYFPYDPGLRFLVAVDWEVDAEVFEIPLRDDGRFHIRRLGRVQFEWGGAPQSLSLFWIMGYGGGLFLPFRDATRLNGETYGGSRYLLDTIKGADLGSEDGKLVLDFNFAYNPSCAYSPRWDCPLAPQENWLDVPIPAGEKAFSLD